MCSPLISVIVPVYNAEKTLEKCLQSLQKQTYSHIEFILVNDGSIDRSGEICDQYAKMDTRFCVIHQQNQGVAAARNAGLSVATGDWFGFVDSDDYLEFDMYAYLLSLAQQYGADIAQCGVFWEEANVQRELPSPSQELCIETGREPLPSIFWQYFSHYTWSKLFAKHVVHNLTFNMTYVIGEDVLFNLMALRNAERVVLGEKAQYHYWQNPESACHAVVNKQKLISARRMFLFAEHEFRNRQSIARFCRESNLRNNLDICSKIVCNGLSEQYKELIDLIRQEMRVACCTEFINLKFSTRERLKSALIGYFWPVYRIGLPIWKKIKDLDSGS